MKIRLRVNLLFLYFIYSLALLGNDVNTGLYHYNLSDSLFREPQRSLYHAQIALPLLLEHKLFEKYCYLLNTKSYLFQVTEQLDSMEINNKFAYSESLSLLSSGHLEHIKSRNNLARIYRLKGKFIEAKDLYTDALIRAKRSEIEDLNLIGTLHENLGEIYRKLEDHELALYQYQKALILNEKYVEATGLNINQFNLRYVVIKTAIANIYKDLKKYDTSYELYTGLSNYIESFSTLTNKTNASFYYNYADLLKEDSQFRKSKDYFIKALEYSKELPLEKSMVFEKMAELYLLENNTIQTISSIDQAIKSSPNNLQLRKVQLQLKLLGSISYSAKLRDSIESVIINDLQIHKFEEAVFKGELKNTSTYHLREIIDYYTVKLSTENLDLKDRINTYKFVTHAMMGIVTFQYFQDSQFGLLKDIREIVYNALDFILSNFNNEPGLWDEALYFIEQGKSILFYIEGQIGDKDQSSKNKYQTRITELNYILKNPNLGADIKHKYKKEIIELTDSLLLNENTVILNLPFESTHLAYYLQNKNLISYLTNEKDIYVCSKIEGVKEFRIITLEEFNQNICFAETDECKNISQQILPRTKIQTNSSITISPDGWLHTLPFDLFYDGNAQLITKANVLYSYSLLGDLKNANKPYFENSDSYFFQLPLSSYSSTHQTVELNTISPYFDKHFSNLACTKEAFMYALSNGEMIHLSSHAESNSDSSSAHLKFAEDKLSLFDVYNLNIDPKLLVLSSCNNEVGEFNPGEGSNSLGRAFYYAGAKNIISSLWELNEKSSALIFEQFYKNFNNGKSSAEALRMAKLDYLNNTQSDRERNPYYWAGIVCIGDVSNEGLLQSNMSDAKLYLIPLILLILYVLFRKYRNQFL